MNLTKEVLVKCDAAVELMQWTETNGATLKQKLEEHFKPYLQQGETMPDVGLLLDLMARSIADRVENAKNADRKHSQEKDEDSETREARDEADAVAREELTFLRSSLEGAHGKEALGRTGVPSRVPPTAKQLRDVLANSLSRLDSGVKLPPPRKPNIPSWSEQALKTELQSILSPLEQALKNLSRELRESEVALTEKWQAINALHATNLNSISVLIGFAKMVGLDDLADRIRVVIPSRPSTNNTESTTETEATPNPEASPATETNAPA